MINYKIKEYVLLACVLLAVFGVYLSTMHPIFKNNDSPETTAVAVTLGIGHPPGYPLYTIAGKIRTLIPTGNYAFRMNIFSAALAILTLLVTYLILTKFIFRLFIPEVTRAYWVLGLGSVIILAFSNIFWNQALEAKGGIYMLNLLFLSLCILLSLSIFAGAEKKSFYVFSFLLGLSLSNHWPSVIILMPVFAYVFIKYRQLLKLRGFIFCLFFMILGMTPYLYLPIRANAVALFNWGDPKDLQGLLWVVLRQGYTGPAEANAHVFKYQVLEFLKVFFTNYSLFFILAIAGAHVMNKKSKMIFRYLAAIFLIVVVMVVFYNRTKEGVKYLLDIFLIPAEYICLLFIAAGAAYFLSLFENRKKLIYPSAAAALVLFAFMGYRHYELNNSGRDFLSYDFGRAILGTMEQGSVYVADGDYNLMPVYYLQEIMKERQDVITATDSFLIFDWGIDEFVKRHGNVVMKPYDTANNEKNIIAAFISARNIYRTNYFPRFDNMSLPYAQQQNGILTKITVKNRKTSSLIFDMYSYRGVYDSFCVLNPANIDLIGWYAVSMVNQANALNQAGRTMEAIKLYKRALNFPNEKPEANIRYNIALAYEKSQDYDNELLYLKSALKIDKKMLQAMEKAGILYYEKALYVQAKDMFDSAIALGSSNEMVKKGSNILNSMSQTDRLEAMLIKANEYIEKQDLKKASEIYDFLLEKHYKSAIIYRNIGVYHSRTNSFEAAISNFKLSNIETPSADAYLYTAYAYFKFNMIEKALNEIETGLKQFADDKRLNDLYGQLKAQEKSNEKNSDSDNRQR